jgi:hypothetical protein
MLHGRVVLTIETWSLLHYSQAVCMYLPPGCMQLGEEAGAVKLEPQWTSPMAGGWLGGWATDCWLHGCLQHADGANLSFNMFYIQLSEPFGHIFAAHAQGSPAASTS